MKISNLLFLIILGIGFVISGGHADVPSSNGLFTKGVYQTSSTDIFGKTTTGTITLNPVANTLLIGTVVAGFSYLAGSELYKASDNPKSLGCWLFFGGFYGLSAVSDRKAQYSGVISFGLMSVYDVFIAKEKDRNNVFWTNIALLAAGTIIGELTYQEPKPETVKSAQWKIEGSGNQLYLAYNF